MARLPTNYIKHTSNNPIQKFLINNFYKEFFTIVKKTRVESILDAGCGEGFTLDKLQRGRIGKQLEGIDSSERAIELGRKQYPNLSLQQGNIYELPYRNNSFDLVIATEVLEHVKDPQKALQELARVSKKYIVLSVPNEPLFTLANFLRGKYWKTFGNHTEHIQHWTSGGFSKFLRSHGLKIMKKSHPFPWALVLARK